MYRRRTQEDASNSDTPESDVDQEVSWTSESSSAEATPSNSRTRSATESQAISTARSSEQQPSVTPSDHATRFDHRSSPHSQNPLRDPNEQSDPVGTTQQDALRESRTAAASTVAECCQLLTMLEVSRMTSSRMGTAAWLNFWSRVYTREFHRPLREIIFHAARRIDTLFRDTADRLRVMLYQRYNNIRYAATEAQIAWEMQILEESAVWYRDRRRRKAQRVMNKLQTNVQNVLDKRITPEKMIDMKREIFAMDSVCDYYPYRLELRNLTVSQASATPAPEFPIVYDPSLDPRRPSLVFHEGQWVEIPAGYRPAGDYVMDPTRLV